MFTKFWGYVYNGSTGKFCDAHVKKIHVKKSKGEY